MRARHESLWSTAVHLRGNPRAAVWTEPMWGLSMALVLPYASVYMLALGLRDQQIGLLATIGILSQTVFGLLGGVITDKLGRRTTTAVFDLVAWSVPCLVWAVAQNFWYFLGASLVNGAWQVTQNSWDCLLVEDAEPRLITRIYSLVRVAADLSALFAPVAAVLVAQFGLVPAVRILYLNAFVVMTAKVWLLYRFSTETATGRTRMAATAGRSMWSLLREYRGVWGLARRTPGTLYALAVMAVVAAVTLVTGTFWQIAVSQRLGVPDALLPFFPMVRSILSVLFFFTVIPRLTATLHLRRPTRWGSRRLPGRSADPGRDPGAAGHRRAGDVRAAGRHPGARRLRRGHPGDARRVARRAARGPGRALAGHGPAAHRGDAGHGAVRLDRRVAVRDGPRLAVPAHLGAAGGRAPGHAEGAGAAGR